MDRTFQLERKNENKNDAIDFLNLSLKTFYKNDLRFKDFDYDMFFKASLLMAMNDIEGTIKGTFNCDLSLDQVDIKTIKKMFPVGCKVLNIKTSNDIPKLGNILVSLRNVNAHAIVSSDDITELQEIEVDWDKIVPFNPSIYLYNSKGNKTLANLVMLIMLFLRKESIEKLCKSSFVFSLISCGEFKSDDGQMYVDNINHVDLETPIRKKEGKNLFDSIIGEYKKFVKKVANDEYELLLTPNNSVTFNASFSLENEKKLIVKERSLTKAFYDSDYVLLIEDKKGFIKLANKYPPFVFIDLLFKLGIKVFDEAVYEMISSNDLYLKLNYSKFYIDKNIDILLAPPSIADIRIISSTINSAINTILLRLEKAIYKCFQYEVSKRQYSKIKDAFEIVKFDKDLKRKAIILRNFSMHNYLINEYAFLDGSAYKYDIDFVVGTLRIMEEHFRQTDTKLFNKFANDVRFFFVERLISVKYGKIVDYSIHYLSGSDKYDPESQDVKNKFLFVNHSVYDICILNSLFVGENPKTYVLKYIVEGEERPIYIRTFKKHNELLEEYLKQSGPFVITSEENRGVVKTIVLAKEE